MGEKQPQRKALRLSSFDYSSPGAYFVTICTKGKEKILSTIKQPKTEGDFPIVLLSPFGRIVEEMIQKIPGIDHYVVMPNHVHLIIFNDESGAALSGKIRFFKANTTRKLKQNIWQRSYYEHVIRDQTDYLVKWKYIDDNPAKWATDENYVK